MNIRFEDWAREQEALETPAQAELRRRFAESYRAAMADPPGAGPVPEAPDAVVRRAAAVIRARHAPPAHPFWETLAGELEKLCGDDAYFGRDGKLVTDWCDEPAAAESALAIARAYLDEQEETRS